MGVVKQVENWHPVPDFATHEWKLNTFYDVGVVHSISASTLMISQMCSNRIWNATAPWREIWKKCWLNRCIYGPEWIKKLAVCGGSAIWYLVICHTVGKLPWKSHLQKYYYKKSHLGETQSFDLALSFIDKKNTLEIVPPTFVSALNESLLHSHNLEEVYLNKLISKPLLSLVCFQFTN